MTADAKDIDDDVTEAINDRVAALKELARLRRERRERDRAAKKARRDVGLRARHARKLNRFQEDK